MFAHDLRKTKIISLLLKRIKSSIIQVQYRSNFENPNKFLMLLSKTRSHTPHLRLELFCACM